MITVTGVPPDDRPAAPRAVVVATANAASGRDHRGRPDLAPWARSVADLGADVLAVQEVDHLLPRSGGADQTAEIAEAAGYAVARFAAAVHGTPGRRETFRPAAATVADEPSYGVALLSRHPVSRWWEHRMSPSRVQLPLPLPADGGDGGAGTGARVMWVPDEQRVALAARVAHPAGDLTVVCTHLSFAPLRAATQLRELVTWAADLPRPLVLLGDLNLPGRLPGRVTRWTPAIEARTYPSARPVAQLDHVLLDDPSGVWGSPVGTAVTVGQSDHLALRVELPPR